MEKFLHSGSVERVLYRGSMDNRADPLLGIKHHNRFLPRGSVEKFLRRGSVERVLYRGSMDDCTGPLLGIKHHNRLLEQKRRSSYTVEVWKGSYTVEAWMIVLICCWVSSTIIDS